MYFPYLYGRAAELAALTRQAHDLGTPQLVVPVIEPALAPDAVLTRYVSLLSRTLATLKGNGASAYVVVNPHQGAFQDPTVVAHWTAAMSGALQDPATVRPAFKVRGTSTAVSLRRFYTDFAGRDVGLVVEDERIFSAAQLSRFAGSANVMVFLAARVDPTPFVREFGSKRVVRIVENFQAQQRNADYSGRQLLATNHLTYAAEGLGGFSDYTVLPSTVTFSGGRTGAAVVHLTYAVAGGDFWIEHFVSDETDISQGTFQSKLLEALAHMDAAMVTDPTRFPQSPAVVDYRQQFASLRATSQGKNKELQVRHHLYVVARHLGI